jgi:hypothetical protein
MRPRFSFPAVLLIAFLTALAAGLLAAGAEARVEAESEYTKAQTYSGALRYLRVDLGYEVVEKDPDAAYLIFRYTQTGQNKRPTNGTIEVVETRGRVKVLFQIPEMPEYHERVLRDGLLKKLRLEYGAPPPKAPVKEERPEGKRPADAGAG